MSLKKYEEAITNCKKAIEIHNSSKGLKTVYVTYGNALDALLKTDQSLEIYNEGIAKFPDYYQLFYNKGITLSSVKKNDEAMKCFQKSAYLNPNHASSNHAMGRVLYNQEKNIPALLAFCRFLVLEPQGKRAEENLDNLRDIMKANVKKTGDNSITINIDQRMLDNNSKKDRIKENNFSTTELILSLDAALDFDDKNSKKTEVEQFIRKFETICSSLEEMKSKNFGFYWNYYVPYFLEIKNKKMLTTFAYIVFASSDKPGITDWLETHKTEIDNFFEWNKSYVWPTK
jgi:tetratricopeptide (TPR) repeat protein